MEQPWNFCLGKVCSISRRKSWRGLRYLTAHQDGCRVGSDFGSGLSHWRGGNDYSFWWRGRNVSNGSDFDFYKAKAKQKQVFFCKVVIPSHSLDVLKSHFRVTRATLEKFCREVEDTGRIPQGNRFGRPPIPCEGDRLKSMERLSKEWKGAKSVSAECTDYCGQPKWRWAFEYIFSNTRYLPIPRERHSWFESDSMESALKRQIVHWSTEIEATFSQNDRGKFLSVDLELAWNTSNVVMEHENPLGAFQPEKWGYLFRRSTFTGNFPGKGTNQRIVFHLAPNRNFRTFFLNGKCRLFVCVSRTFV